MTERVKQAKQNKEVVSIAYQGNIVDVWEHFDKEDLFVDLGSDQTSLHNPWAGGYYPVGMSLEESNEMMANDPETFKTKVQESLRRQTTAINNHTLKGTYFFDYGNAFLLEASRAGANIYKNENAEFVDASSFKESDLENAAFAYPSYVQDIMGPMCFDYGFGPFRWVCASGLQEDLDKTDKIATEVLERLKKRCSGRNSIAIIR